MGRGSEVRITDDELEAALGELEREGALAEPP